MGKLGKKYLFTFYGSEQEINPPAPHLLISHTCSSSAKSLFAYAALSSDFFQPIHPCLTLPEPDLLLSLLPEKPAFLLSQTTRLSNPVSARWPCILTV